MSRPPQDDLEAFMAPTSYGPPSSNLGTTPTGGPAPTGPKLDPSATGTPPSRTSLRPGPPSGWNAPAFGMLAIFLLALGALIWPQWRARATEKKVRPMITALAQRPAGARCPRYITSVFTNVGLVRFDANGKISDHTELTGPICDGVRRLWTPAGRAELQCLVTDGRCSRSALRSVIALSTIAHESMHLKGQLDEAQAECESIAAAPRSAELAGLTNEQGRMIAWIHYAALNPNTPPQYHLSLQNCPSLSALGQQPPGTEASRATVTQLAEAAWLDLGS